MKWCDDCLKNVKTRERDAEHPHEVCLICGGRRLSAARPMGEEHSVFETMMALVDEGESTCSTPKERAEFMLEALGMHMDLMVESLKMGTAPTMDDLSWTARGLGEVRQQVSEIEEVDPNSKEKA